MRLARSARTVAVRTEGRAVTHSKGEHTRCSCFDRAPRALSTDLRCPFSLFSHPRLAGERREFLHLSAQVLAELIGRAARDELDSLLRETLAQIGRRCGFD